MDFATPAEADWRYPMGKTAGVRAAFPVAASVYAPGGARDNASVIHNADRPGLVEALDQGVTQVSDNLLGSWDQV